MGHIALISTDAEITRVALSALRKHTEYQLITVETVTDYKIWARTNHAHGVMIDMKTLLRGDHDERFYINELSKFLPVAKVRCVPGKDMLTGSFEWEGSSSDEAGEEDFLVDFVGTMKQFEDSLLRRDSVRKPVILNLCIHHVTFPAPLLTNTVNVSMGGLFFICTLPLPKDRWVQVEFADFRELPLLRAEIRWHLEWGKTRNHYAGFGVKFEHPSELHLAVLGDL